MVEERPETKLTEWLTNPKGDHSERTRVMMREQKQVYNAYHFLSQFFGIKYLSDIIDEDKKIMMAFKGERSREITEALVHYEPEEYGIHRGLRGYEVTRKVRERNEG